MQEIQARYRVLRLEWAKYILRRSIFLFYYMLKTNFSGHYEIWGRTKLFEGTASECPRGYENAEMCNRNCVIMLRCHPQNVQVGLN